MATESHLDQELPLCALSDLAEQEAMEMLVEGRQLFALRVDNHIYAYWNICPHMGIPLNWVPNRFLDFDKALIQCSSHGALFNIETGKCIAGPCNGESLQRLNYAVIRIATLSVPIKPYPQLQLISEPLPWQILKTGNRTFQDNLTLS